MIKATKLYKRIILLIGITGCLALSGCGAGNEYVARGMARIAEGEYYAAMENFTQAEEEGENQRLIARGRGIAQMGLGDIDEAIDSFLECLSLSNGFIQEIDYDTNYYLASAYLKNGEPEKAIEVYNAILHFKENDTDTLFYRGIAYFEADMAEKAFDDFQKVYSNAPSDYSRLMEIFKVMDNYGYSLNGREYLNVALEVGKGKISDYELGLIYYYLKDYKQAYNYLESARREGIREACYYLGLSYEATLDYNYALSVYENYINTMGEDGLIYNQIGLCKMKLGDYEGALSAFQSGMQTETDLKAELSFNEIVALEYLGDFTNAKALIEAYTATYPSDKRGLAERDFLRTR